MPSNVVSQIQRLVDARLNAGTGDPLPGQPVASGTGAAQYLGEVGARIALSPADIRFNSAVGTLFGGVYQYVLMAFTTNQPTRGKLVFWDLSVAESLYQVNGDAKPTTAIPTLIAGIVINSSVVNATYAWMQIMGRASVLFDSAITAAAAGNPVSAKISAAVASTADVGVSVVTATIPIGPVDALIGIAETTPVVSTISVVQLINTLGFRRF